MSDGLFREEWLHPGAVVPVDANTTGALLREVQRLRSVEDASLLQVRDYFAWAALHGLLKSRGNVKAIHKHATEINKKPDEFIASEMYRIADAMVKERNK